MKFIIENIGVFRYAEYDLADLTIICGKNNTGKTYATYCMYAFFDYFRRGYDIPIQRKYLQPLFEKGMIAIDLDFSQKDIDKYLDDASRQFLRYLPRIFSAQERYFSDSRIQVKVDISEIVLPNEFKHSYRSNQKEFLQIIKPKRKNELLVSLLLADGAPRNQSFEMTVVRIISDALKEVLFSNIFRECFVASAERTGAVIFKDELNVQKNTLLKEVINSGDIDVKGILNKIYNTAYALPVRRNIDFIRNLDSISKNEGVLCQKYPDIITELQEIVGGTYKASKESLFFYPQKTRSVKLSIGESASSVRSLLDVFFYLKHVAKPGHILIIDEPELNLHPESQRKFARLLAKLVNCGMQVFITTHSDYIVKEFNTLLMLGSRSENEQIVSKMRRWGYQKTELLSVNQVKMFISKKENILLPQKQRKTKIQTLVPAIISPKFGVEAMSFDDTINEMNSIQESIMFS